MKIIQSIHLDDLVRKKTRFNPKEIDSIELNVPIRYDLRIGKIKTKYFSLKRFKATWKIVLIISVTMFLTVGCLMYKN